MKKPPNLLYSNSDNKIDLLSLISANDPYSQVLTT